MENLSHWRKAVAGALLGLAMLCAAPAQAADESLEYPVKAAFLAKFGSFVEWPAGAFATPTSALQLCVLGDDPFGAVLDRAVSGQQATGRAIEVRRLKAVRPDTGCHIVYIAPSEASRLAQVAEGLRGGAVLTVSDVKPAGAVGIINFVVKDERVRFDIDDEAAAQNKLAISSKLLGVALNVKARKARN
ncbi:MAG TPA: YfiR family protein [Ramlibacter sp.]|nr:YfiR family protein [Ramlibacter sp.]